MDEIRILFAPTGIDLLTYPTSKDEREFFWGPTGPFVATNQVLSCVIIFVTQSVSNFKILAPFFHSYQLYRPCKENMASCIRLSLNAVAPTFRGPLQSCFATLPRSVLRVPYLGSNIYLVSWMRRTPIVTMASSTRQYSPSSKNVLYVCL